MLSYAMDLKMVKLNSLTLGSCKMGLFPKKKKKWSIPLRKAFKGEGCPENGIITMFIGQTLTSGVYNQASLQPFNMILVIKRLIYLHCEEDWLYK